jgi:hypothetical protein
LIILQTLIPCQLTPSRQKRYGEQLQITPGTLSSYLNGHRKIGKALIENVKVKFRLNLNDIALHIAQDEFLNVSFSDEFDALVQTMSIEELRRRLRLYRDLLLGQSGIITENIKTIADLNLQRQRALAMYLDDEKIMTKMAKQIIELGGTPRFHDDDETKTHPGQ